MTWQTARRLTAESDKWGDKFFESRKAWLSERSTVAMEACVACAREYDAALDAEIATLKSLAPTEKITTTLHRAQMYKRLLARQLERMMRSDAAAARRLTEDGR